MTVYIYELLHPVTRVAFYIGCSENPKLRLLQHAGTPTTNTGWDIKNHGMRPILNVIDSCERHEAYYLEIKYVNEYISNGVALENKRLKPSYPFNITKKIKNTIYIYCNEVEIIERRLGFLWTAMNNEKTGPAIIGSSDGYFITYEDALQDAKMFLKNIYDKEDVTIG